MNTEGNSTGSSGSAGITDNIYKLIKKLWIKLPSWAKGTLLPFFIFGLLMVIMYFAMGRDMKEVVSSLDNFSVLTGTFTTILAVTTWVSLQRLRNNVQSSPGFAGDDAAILIIDLDMNITQNVISYCSGREEFKQVMDGNDFPKPHAFDIINKDNNISGFYIDELLSGKRILHITRNSRIDNAEFQSLAAMVYSTFNKVDGALHENGIGTLYVFYAGMAAIPFFIGELFGNRYDVHIYQYQNSGSSDNPSLPGMTYYFCGRMNHLSYK